MGQRQRTACPYRCPYCHNNGVAQVIAGHGGLESSNNSALGFLRYRPAEDMVRELRSIRDRYSMEAFAFIDDTFTMNHEWLAGFLDRYRAEVDVPFICNTTAIDLDGSILDHLTAAGCRIVRLGVESGSQRILGDVLKRRFISQEQLRWAFRAIQERGMHALAFSMIGNYGETPSETLETFRFNAELRPTSMTFSLAQPYPGTDYFDRVNEKGGLDESRRTHNFIESSILKRDDRERLWLDKVRTFYFWYVNRYLENEASPLFERLIERLEGLGAESWSRPGVRRALWRRHQELSEELQASGVMHYTTPFPERPDIVVSSIVVAEKGEWIRREVAEPH